MNLIERVDDLIKQATAEESHFYTANVLRLVKVELERQEILKETLCAIATAPYPLHEHCTEEQWRFACNLYMQRNEAKKNAS